MQRRNVLPDTNVFLEAFLSCCGMDLAPGFWDWQEEENKGGAVFSNTSVLTEL